MRRFSFADRCGGICSGSSNRWHGNCDPCGSRPPSLRTSREPGHATALASELSPNDVRSRALSDQWRSQVHSSSCFNHLLALLQDERLLRFGNRCAFLALSSSTRRGILAENSSFKEEREAGFRNRVEPSVGQAVRGASCIKARRRAAGAWPRGRLPPVARPAKTAAVRRQRGRRNARRWAGHPPSRTTAPTSPVGRWR